MSENLIFEPADENWCDVCHNTGVVPCLCGGDACACGMETHDCQHCDSEMAPPDDIDDLAEVITEILIAEGGDGA